MVDRVFADERNRPASYSPMSRRLVDSGHPAAAVTTRRGRSGAVAAAIRDSSLPDPHRDQTTHCIAGFRGVGYAGAGLVEPSPSGWSAAAPHPLYVQLKVRE
jgi:hypothetical protein